MIQFLPRRHRRLPTGKRGVAASPCSSPATSRTRSSSRPRQRAGGDVAHGFPTSSWDWARLEPLLAADRHRGEPRLLGYAVDKPPHHRIQHREHARIVHAVWQHLSVDTSTVVAHDVGRRSPGTTRPRLGGGTSTALSAMCCSTADCSPTTIGRPARPGSRQPRRRPPSRRAMSEDRFVASLELCSVRNTARRTMSSAHMASTASDGGQRVIPHPDALHRDKHLQRAVAPGDTAHGALGSCGSTRIP
jgi:pimeloyl-ACP methyl ester carboxylesterase